MLRWFAGSVYGCYQWLAMAAVLGFARRHLTADSPVRRYLTDAIFPYYIMKKDPSRGRTNDGSENSRSAPGGRFSWMRLAT